MKYKLIYLTLVVFLWTVSELSVANETSREGKFFSSNKLYNSTDLNKIVLTKNDAVKMRNSTLCERAVQVDETNNDSNNPAHFCREPGFGDAIKRCMSERRSKIIENFARGKVIITNCFKAAVIFSFFKYLTMPPNSSIKLFNGVVEFVKISDPLLCSGIGECNNVRMKNDSDKNEYLYGRVVEKIVDADSENENLNADDLVGNSNNGSKNVLWETITNLLDEKSEEEEEEVLKKELTDKKILAALNALSRNYILKINAFSDITMRMKRNLNDKISFSVEETSELLDSIAKTKNESSVTVGHAGKKKKKKNLTYW